MGRLMGTIGSGVLYTYVGEYLGPLAGNDAVAGIAACFLAGTICSFLAVVITQRIEDNAAGLKCGSCLTIAQAAQQDIDDLPDSATAVSGLDNDNEALYAKGSVVEVTERAGKSESEREEEEEMWA